MPIDFENYALKGNEFVALVSDDLSVTKVRAGRIIRAVFHSLRNRLTHEESFNLLAQLPISLKGVYVDGWNFSKDYNKLSHLNDFLDEVRWEDGGLDGYDFGDSSATKKAVSAVFNALKYFISEGEIQDIIDILPSEVKTFIKDCLFGTEVIL
jgi:uncharacterized protein (DUF2267 family)